MRPAPARPIGEGSTEGHPTEPHPADVRPTGVPSGARSARIPAGGAPGGTHEARRQTWRRGALGLACGLWAVTLFGCLPKRISNPDEVSLTEGRVRGIGVGDPIARNLSPLPVSATDGGDVPGLFAGVARLATIANLPEGRLFQLDCCGGGAWIRAGVQVLAPLEPDGSRRVRAIHIRSMAPADLEPQALIGVSNDGKVALFHTARPGVYLTFRRSWKAQKQVREPLGILFAAPDLATSGLLASDLKAPDSDEALVFAHADQAQAAGGIASRMAPYLKTRPPFLQFLEDNAALMAQCTEATPETRAVCDQHIAPVVARHRDAWAEELAQLPIEGLVRVGAQMHRSAPLSPPDGPSLWESARALKIEALRRRGQVLTAAGVAHLLPGVKPTLGPGKPATPRLEAREILAPLASIFPPVRVKGASFGTKPKPVSWRSLPGHFPPAEPGASGWVEVEIVEVDTVATQVSNTSLRTKTEFSPELKEWQARRAPLLDKLAKATTELEANRNYTQQVDGDVTGQRSTRYVNSEGREVFTVSANESVRGLKYETNHRMKSHFEGARITLAEVEAQIDALGPAPVAPTRQFTSGHQTWSGSLRWQATVRGPIEGEFDFTVDAAGALPASRSEIRGPGDVRWRLHNVIEPKLQAWLAARLRTHTQPALDRHLAGIPEGPLRQEEAAWARHWRGEPPAAGDASFGIPVKP